MKMNKLTLLLGAILFVINGITVNAYSQTVTLDNTFGRTGVARFSKGTGITCLDFDSHGNVISVGYDELSGGEKYHLIITKTNADGVLDESFGNNGFATATGYDQIMPWALKMRRDNKICVLAEFEDIQMQKYHFMLMQFNENGSVDEDFGDKGKVNLNLNSDDLILLNFDMDDFMLIAKTDYQNENQVPHIVKYSYDGKIDETFGETGTVYLTSGINPYCMSVLNDGSILVAGAYNEWPDTELGLCKLKPNGELDTDFAENGIWHKNIMQDIHVPVDYIDLLIGYEFFSNILEDSEGNLILSGAGLANKSEWGNKAFLCKFTPDGIFDTDFGEDGFYCSDITISNKPIFQIGNQYVTAAGYSDGHRIIVVSHDGKVGNETYACAIDYFQDMKLQGTNKIILGGSYEIKANTPANFALERIVVRSETQGNDNHYDSNAPMIFPNPAQEILYFSRETAFELINLQGQILLKSETPVKLVSISHLEVGIYFVRFAGSHSIRKFIKK